MRSSFDRIGVVFRKEVLDNTRDRRTLAGALFYPLLGPLLTVLLFAVIGRTFTEQAEKKLLLPVAGAENAPALIHFLEQNNVSIQPAPPDPKAAVRAGDVEVVLLIPPGYAADFAAGRPATVQLVVDESRQSAMVTTQRAKGLLTSYAQEISAQRLLARGISPQIIHPLAVENIDTSTPQSQAAQFLNIAPYFMIFSVFIGGMYLAIDTTAGERERGSLEPLVINPITRWELVLGKLGATIVFTIVGVLETVIAFSLVLNLVPLEEYFGARFSLDALSLLAIFLICLPMVLLAAALQFIIATFTRSFKEAQNYLSFLPLIPALPGMFLAFVPVKIKLWMMMIPTFGQQLLILQLMRGETVSGVNVAVNAATTLVLGAAFVFIAARLYEKEQVLFSK